MSSYFEALRKMPGTTDQKVLIIIISIIIIDQETKCWTCLYFEKVSHLAMGKNEHSIT